jgi:DNA-binding response OmpR family regulator
MAGESKSQRPKRVLIVDDDSVLSGVLSLALRHAGFETETAANGEAALAAVEVFQPDAVLVDLVMPVMDGLEFLKKLREKAPTALPAVVLTGLDSRSHAVDALVAGAADVLVKPVDRETLVERLERVLPR